MAAITWDKIGRRPFNYGVSNGVLYKWDGEYFTKGVAWNGLVSVADKPSGKEKTALYSGDVLKGYELSHEEYGGEIKAIMYPEEFLDCLGYKQLVRGIYYTQQIPTLFGLSYQVQIDDALHSEHRPDIHLIYNCVVADNVSFTHETFGSKQYEEMTIPFVSYPDEVYGYYPLSHIVIRSAYVQKNNAYDELVAMLYGTGSNENTGIPKMPKPSEIITMFDVTVPDDVVLSSSAIMPTRKGTLVRP